jgi:hypothetical protein
VLNVLDIYNWIEENPFKSDVYTTGYLEIQGISGSSAFQMALTTPRHSLGNQRDWPPKYVGADVSRRRLSTCRLTLVDTEWQTKRERQVMEFCSRLRRVTKRGTMKQKLWSGAQVNGDAMGVDTLERLAVKAVQKGLSIDMKICSWTVMELVGWVEIEHRVWYPG